MGVLDYYLPHFDAVLRHGVLIPAPADAAYARVQGFDFAQMCEPVGRAIGDMRGLPRFIADVAHQARRLPPDARFTLGDAPRSGFVLLSEDRRHLVLGAVGKLWKPRFELVQLTREEFLAFRSAKYVKAAFGFVVRPYGKDRAQLRHEARFLATDDSARTHFRRAWEVAEPFAAFFMQRALEALTLAVTEQQAATRPPPPWRPSFPALPSAPAS
jgi:hypothetical protein